MQAAFGHVDILFGGGQVCAANAIPKREKLPIVVVELEMVLGVVVGAVDDAFQRCAIRNVGLIYAQRERALAGACAADKLAAALTMNRNGPQLH